MTATELANLTRFDMLNVWGLNVTCLPWNGTGSEYPANCGSGGCSCAAPTREQQLFATDMNSALHVQAAALKAVRPLLPVVGYIDFPTSQQYFPAQLQLCTDPALADWRLATAANGVVDCFKLPSAACNHQGMEFCQPDFRIPAARDWWVGTVLRALIDSPSIDGSFLDECDQFYEMCGHINCTPKELADIEAGTLLALDAALAFAASLGKWLVVSITATRSTQTPVHAFLVASLLAHKSGFRFYEGFTNVEQMLTMAEEVEAGIPVQAHAYSMTHAPDFVELALFLLAAGPYSYFSYSGGWGFDSFAWLPEYDLPLGAPLGPYVVTNSTGPSIPPWTPQPTLNLICGMPGHAPGIIFVGALPNAAACYSAVRGNTSFTMATYVKTPNSYAGCWARTQPLPSECMAGGGCGAPCFMNFEADCESAFATAIPGMQHTTYTREFEHLTVTYDTNNHTAHLTPRAT
jgi:hypothetical protein